MGLIELFLIAVGLSMDAFAVSVCKGLSIDKARVKDALVVGLYFGLFQAAMPLIGYLLGSQFADSIMAFDHWIAFILLAVIGGKMMLESAKQDEPEEDKAASIAFSAMIPLAIATSIDALAVGVSFAFLNVSIVPAVSFIGIVTFLLSAMGVMIGKVVGDKLKSRAEFVGGCILVLMGGKILLEHLGLLPW